MLQFMVTNQYVEEEEEEGKVCLKGGHVANGRRVLLHGLLHHLERDVAQMQHRRRDLWHHKSLK